MVDHTIEAKFEVQAGANAGPKPTAGVDLGDLVKPVAAALREVAQAQCADGYERHALEILTALRVIGEYQSARRQVLIAAAEAHMRPAPAAPAPFEPGHIDARVTDLKPWLNNEAGVIQPAVEPAVPADTDGGNQD